MAERNDWFVELWLLLPLLPLIVSASDFSRARFTGVLCSYMYVDEFLHLFLTDFFT